MKKSRGILLAGNWKMNLGLQSTEKFFSEFENQVSPLSALIQPLSETHALEICIIPPFLSLLTAQKLSCQLPFSVTLGAQNAHWEKAGAFTGEVSGAMLKEIDIPLVLVGHSERRQFFGETDESVRKRTESLLAQGFRVILCIGETREQRDSGNTEAILMKQLESATGFEGGRLMIAYEPVWAIGTGLTATPLQAEGAHQMIRKFLWDHFGLQTAGKTKILYGGSVTPKNCGAILDCPNIDGALIGGASVKPENWISFIETALKIL